MTLRGQIAVVTGATGGIGQAISDRLAAAGAHLVLLGRSARALEALVQQHGWNPTAVECHAADLASESDLRSVASRLATSRPEVHLLVHAAGSITSASVEDSALADFDAQYHVNLRGPYQLTQALLPQLIRAQGQVVFINSSVGIHARRGVAQYAATKHALRAVADSLREEVNERGVRVLSVFLGRTASRMQLTIHEEEKRAYRPERLLQPADVATMVVAALSLPRTAEVTDLHVRPMLKL
jgi:NADP-dependent 3-hydroxy acid dehydrogenase YdfG